MSIRNIIKKKNITIGIIIILIISMIISSIILIKEEDVYINSSVIENDYHKIIYNNEEYLYNTFIISILFLGIDTVDESQNGQADLIQLILLDRESKTIKVISLSRDIMTEIKLFDVSRNELGWHRQHLALAYSYGESKASGSMLTSQAISRMLGDIPIVNYASMDLSMINKIHNIVGELEVELPNNSLVDINKEWVKGKSIKVTKENVEDFIRRRDINEEFSNNLRMERQKVYFTAYFEKIKKMLKENFDETIEIIYNSCKEMTTNISFKDIKTFAEMILEYKFDVDKDYYVLKGKNVLGELHDEYEIDEDYLKELVIELFYKKED